MRPSFQSFYKFLEDNKDYIRFRDKLHSLFFMNKFSNQISIPELMNSLDINWNEAKEIFLSLVKYEIIIPNNIECECGENNSVSNTYCTNCGNHVNIDDAYAEIDSCLPKEDADILNLKYNDNGAINIFAKEWNKSREIVYILLDLVDSQNVQSNLDIEEYNTFLEDIRDLISNECLEYIDGEYLVLGEIGDCFIITLTYKPDAIYFFKRFSKKLATYIKEKNYPSINKELVKYFPYFTATATVLGLPDAKNGKELNPKNIIYKTLSGSIGFNSQELTTFYRLDSGVGVKDKMVFEDHNLALWITEKFINKIGLKDIPTVKNTVGKKGRVKEEVSTGLLLFNNGQMEIVKNPEEYKKE